MPRAPNQRPLVNRRPASPLDAGRQFERAVHTRPCSPVVVFLTFCGIIALLLPGCVAPRPQSFVDADALPSGFVGREHRAFARGERLIVEVSQSPGWNVVGFDAFEQDGSLYVSPRCISSGGGGTARFEVDVSKFQLGADWPQHVYWLLQSYAYPVGHSGFWSREKRSPWVRRKMEAAKQ